MLRAFFAVGTLVFHLGFVSFALGAVQLPDAQFEAYVGEVLKQTGAPGAAVAVVGKSGLLYAKGFGTRNIETGEPITERTLFAIGSTTKAMVAMSAAMLVDEGKIRWEQPVAEILPDFRLADATATQSASLLHLLGHRTGLPRHDLVWYGSPRNEDQLYAALEYLPLSAPFDTRWQYNNLMYMVAGRVIRSVSGQAWNEFLKARVFSPLGMNETTTTLAEFTASSEASAAHQAVRGGTAKKIPYRSVDAVGAAGAVGSSLQEMARWLELHLGRGEFRGMRLVSQTQYDRQLQPLSIAIQKATPEIGMSERSYALGWIVSSLYGDSLVTHGGGIDGFLTHVSFMPEQGIGVVVFVNSDGLRPDLVALDVYDHLMARAPKQLSLPKPAPVTPPANPPVAANPPAYIVPTRDLLDFVGDYYHPGYGVVSVSLSPAGPGAPAVAEAIQVVSNGFEVEMKPTSDLEFVATLDAFRALPGGTARFAFDPADPTQIRELFWQPEPAVPALRFQR